MYVEQLHQYSIMNFVWFFWTTLHIYLTIFAHF